MWTMRLLWICGRISIMAASPAPTTFLGQRSAGTFSRPSRQLQTSVYEETFWICDGPADGTCFGWKGCGAGWTDTSNGRPRYWECAKGCHGGMFANEDCSCACQCAPGQHCPTPSPSTTLAPALASTATPTAQPSTAPWYLANASNIRYTPATADAEKRESNTGLACCDRVAVSLPIVLGLLTIIACTCCWVILRSRVDTRVHPQDLEVQHAEGKLTAFPSAELHNEDAKRVDEEKADDVSTEAGSRQGSNVSNASGASSSVSRQGSIVPHTRTESRSGARQGRIMPHTNDGRASLPSVRCINSLSGHRVSNQCGQGHAALPETRSTSKQRFSECRRASAHSVQRNPSLPASTPMYKQSASSQNSRTWRPSKSSGQRQLPRPSSTSKLSASPIRRKHRSVNRSQPTIKSHTKGATIQE